MENYDRDVPGLVECIQPTGEKACPVSSLDCGPGGTGLVSLGCWYILTSREGQARPYECERWSKEAVASDHYSPRQVESGGPSPIHRPRAPGDKAHS